MSIGSLGWILFDENLALQDRFLWQQPELLARHLALGASLALFLHGLTIELNQRSRWSQRLTGWFQQELGHLDTQTILLLALSSGIGEELLFRGVIQAKVGIIIASVLFGVVHWPPRKELRAWTYMAGVIGLLFGLITDLMSSIVPAMVAHVLINFLNLRLIVRSRERSK